MKQLVSKFKKSEKGFTLVELLAVIVILGIILAIAIPAIGSILEGAKTDTNENQIDLIVDAARLADANGDFTSESMTVEQLVTAGYLEDDDDLSGSVTKTKEGNVVTYKYEAGSGGEGGEGGESNPD